MPPVAKALAAKALAAFAVAAVTALPATAQHSLDLPDVSVTAPSAAPTGAASTGGMPMFGNARVEEEKWPEIPCDASRVGAGATPGSCRRGPTQINFEHGDSQQTRQPTNCKIAHDLVIGTLGGLEFEADTLVFDPYYVSAIGHQRQDCYVESVPGHIRAQFIDMNQVARQATGWGEMAEIGDLVTMPFAVGVAHCVALEKRGPRWGGGYIFLIHASICRKDGQPVDPGNIASVVAALQVQQRDSSGNLRQ
jgi:hypothetical protein